MGLVEEAKVVGTALAHENANWDEGTRQAALFFRGRRPNNPVHGFGKIALDSPAWAKYREYELAEQAFFDAYYRRG